MKTTSLRLLTVLLGYFVAQVKTYPIQGWQAYPQTPREYPDDDYYYAPKAPYYYDTPAVSVPESHGQVPYQYIYDPPAASAPESHGQVPYQYIYDPPAASASESHGQVPYQYIYDPYNHYLDDEAPRRHEERLAALPVGQETWFESDTTPRWRSSDVDDVNAAFLDNLILTQMAQDAQRRRENARAAFAPVEYEERDVEDEDVRELKALAGKPLYHVPKTVPRYEDEDYPADDGFINWNGNKRSVSTIAPVFSTVTPQAGDKEVAMPQTYRRSESEQNAQKKRNDFYKTITKLLNEKSKNAQHTQDYAKERRIEKRFVAGDSDLVLELRGLKHRIAT